MTKVKVYKNVHLSRIVIDWMIFYPNYCLHIGKYDLSSPWFGKERKKLFS